MWFSKTYLIHPSGLLWWPDESQSIKHTCVCMEHSHWPGYEHNTWAGLQGAPEDPDLFVGAVSLLQELKEIVFLVVLEIPLLLFCWFVAPGALLKQAGKLSVNMEEAVGPSANGRSRKWTPSVKWAQQGDTMAFLVPGCILNDHGKKSKMVIKIHFIFHYFLWSCLINVKTDK